MSGTRTSRRATVARLGTVAAVVTALVAGSTAAEAQPAGTGSGTHAEGVVQRLVWETAPHDRGSDAQAEAQTRTERRVVTDAGALALPADVAPAAEVGDTVSVEVVDGVVVEAAVVEEAASGSSGDDHDLSGHDHHAQADTASGGNASAGATDSTTTDSTTTDSTTATGEVDSSLAEPAPHEVYVAVVSPQGWTLADNRNTTGSVTTLVDQASAYWSSQTGGAVRFEVAGSLPAYQSAHACDVTQDAYNAMWQEAADRFNATGVDVTTQDRHLLLVLPTGSDRDDLCPYGLATISATGVHSTYNALVVAAPHTSLYAHELGHNLGLGHSSVLRCTTQDALHTGEHRYYAEMATWPTGCAEEEYGDLLDVMGYSGPTYGEGNLNVAHIDDLGVAPAALRTVTGTGVTRLRLAPLSAGPDTVRGIEVEDVGGRTYYLEYRTATGLDTVAGRNPDRPQLGVRVLRESPVRFNGAMLLDGSPTGPGSYDSEWDEYVSSDYAQALATGVPFASADGSVRVRVDSADSTGATLTIARQTALPVPSTVTTPTVPRTSTVGTRLTALSQVTGTRGEPVAGWPTSLQVRAPGTTTWRTVATATTSSTGSSTFSWTHGLTGAYRVVTAARPDAALRSSSTATTVTVARTGLDTTAASVRLGAAVATTGTVSMLPDRVVWLQGSLDGGPYRNVARVDLSTTTMEREAWYMPRSRDPWVFQRAVAAPSTTRAWVSYTPAAKGTWRFRYAVAADPQGRYSAGYSSHRTVSVG